MQGNDFRNEGNRYKYCTYALIKVHQLIRMHDQTKARITIASTKNNRKQY